VWSNCDDPFLARYATGSSSFLIWQIAWHIGAMRTTLDLDDDLVSALASRHPELSKTEAIEAAIRGYLNQSAIDGLRRLAGTMDIEDLSQELRHKDRHT
jgi:hypothetical protein